MYRKCDSVSDNCISCSRWWYSPCCLRRARTQTLLIVCLRFFASRYASHRIRRRLTLLERLIMRCLPIIPHLCLFAHSSLPHLPEEHNSHVQIACKGWKRVVFVLRTPPFLISLQCCIRSRTLYARDARDAALAMMAPASYCEPGLIPQNSNAQSSHFFLHLLYVWIRL